MNEDQREAIALKKFSVISPVLNGQVKNNLEYFKEAAQTPIEMPYWSRSYITEPSLFEKHKISDH